MQTAPVVPVGQFEVKAQGDIVLNNGGGFNISPHLVTGVLDHFVDVDMFLGTGSTDFQLGAMGKFNLLPDLEGQVGLSFNLGLTFIHDNAINSVLTTVGVLASKHIPMGFGAVDPYASFQFEGLIANGHSSVPLTLLVGSKWEVNHTPWHFYSELGMNLHQSLWTLAFGLGRNF